MIFKISPHPSLLKRGREKAFGKERRDIMVGQDLLFLLEKVEKIADQDFDGHLTIMKFTGGWKAMFGTPSLSIPGRTEVEPLQRCNDLEDCLDDLLNVYWSNKLIR
jgi:hypothetical protein